MAVISRIRKHSGWLVALIGVSIAGFILQDAFSGRNQGGRIPKFAVVNGEEIKVQQFEERVEQLSANFQRAQGDLNISQEDLYQIRQQVWLTMVNDKLLGNACKKLGLAVTPKEMNDMFYGQFVHPQVFRAFADPATGQFNRQQVMMFINNFDQAPVEQQVMFHDLEVVIKDERLKSKYYNMVANAYYVPSFYAKYLYEQSSANVSATIASLSYTSIADEDVKLSDADYKTYYDKNKSLFHRTEGSRSVDFVVFDVQPTEADLLDLDNQATELYEELLVEQNLQDFVNAVSTERFDSLFVKKETLNAPWDSLLFKSPKGTYFKPIVRRNRYEMAKLVDVAARPDSLTASHILITYAGSAMPQSTRTQAEAKRVADSLYAVVLRDQSQFAEIARTNSEDGTRETGGNVGWFADGQMVKPFNEAVVKGNVGDIVVVESMFGYHIIRIEGKTRPVEKVMVAFVYLPIEPSASTTKAIYTEANQFFGQCKDLNAFLTAAEAAKLPVRKAEYLTEMDMQLPGLQNARDLVRWAFEKNTEVGQVAPEIYEYDNQYVIAALNQIRKEGYPSLEELMTVAEVQYAVRNEKKAEMLMEKMNDAIKANRSISALETLNAEVETIDQLNFNAYSFGTKGYEPEVVGTAFGKNVNQLSNPIKGRSGVFVIQTMQYIPAEVMEDMSMIQAQMKMMFQQSMVETIRSAMESNAKIVENRAFYF
ncbi:MAG: peptidylprolyl isomerase [Bacteroidales bacterium]|jgi:peptidyl-prolyl cis-trans isomerase D|nr:peptidylprolyl isomerase [Bacteroidales bacterium]